MKLNRRFLRSLKHDISFYISIMVLIVITLLLFYLFNMGGRAIYDYGDTFFASQNIEDAHFTTYLPISDEDIETLEKGYNVTLEEQHYSEIETDGTVARVFKKTEKIDLYDILDGRDVSADNEIIISAGYASETEVSLGDTLTIGDEDYAVVGTFLRPDYLYMLKNEGDSYKNVTTFYLAYMTDAAYEDLDEGSSNYLVIYGEDNEDEFREYINDTYLFSSYSSAKNNERILMVKDQAVMFIEMSYIMLIVVPLFSALIIIIVISRKVKGEQRLIGILYSLGYRRRQLTAHYLGYALIPAALAGVLVTLFSTLGAQQMIGLCLADYEPMPITAHLEVLPIVLGLIIPPVICVLASLISLNRLLKKDPAVLLRGGEEGRKKLKGVFKKSKINFRAKFILRSLLANPGRSLVVILGIFLGDMVFLTGLGLIDSVSDMSETTAKQLGSYEYQYTLSSLIKENTYGGEELFAHSLEDESGLSITLMGIDEDSAYINLTGKDGERADLTEGFYITNLLSLTEGWNAGDTVTLVNPFTLEKSEIKIAGILSNSAQKAIYTTPDEACSLAGLDKVFYNAIVSDKKLDIPEEDLIGQTSMKDIENSADTIMAEMEPFYWVFIFLGAVLCLFAIYIAVNMVVRENRKTISMLKILGYRDTKIDGIVLSVYVIFLPIAFLISIFAAYGIIDFFMMFLTEYNVVLIDSKISIGSLVIAFAISVLVYFGSMLLLSGRVKRVDMIKELKVTDE